MARPTKGPRLGKGPAHQRQILATLAAQLFTHEVVNTTEAKAKAVRPFAEKLITFAKRGDLAARREVLKVIADRDVGLAVAVERRDHRDVDARCFTLRPACRCGVRYVVGHG